MLYWAGSEGAAGQQPEGVRAEDSGATRGGQLHSPTEARGEIRGTRGDVTAIIHCRAMLYTLAKPQQSRSTQLIHCRPQRNSIGLTVCFCLLGETKRDEGAAHGGDVRSDHGTQAHSGYAEEGERVAQGV